MTKWTDERTAQLRSMAGDESQEVSRETVAEIAAEMEITPRSASSKLRKEGYTVENASAAAKSFSDEETEALRDLVTSNSGQFTYAELADQLGTGHSARAVQGKVLSMELTEHVAPTPPKEVERTYSDEETARVVELIRGGSFLEEIAEAVGKPVNSVRGKALSLLKAEQIDALPQQRDKKPARVDFFDEVGDDICGMTVEELVEASGKTARGVKTILTRRKLTAKDYDGAKRAEKAAS